MIPQLALTAGLIPRPMYQVTSVAGMEDVRMHSELCAALDTCGVSESERRELFECLAGVLHVGNLTFTGEDVAAIASTDSLEILERTLHAQVARRLVAPSLPLVAMSSSSPYTPSHAARTGQGLPHCALDDGRWREDDCTAHRRAG